MSAYSLNNFNTRIVAFRLYNHHHLLCIMCDKNERFIFERQQINEHNSGFELVYPPLGDDELEAEYESMI